MDCQEARMKLQALLDSELEEAEITPVMNHMESCYVCRQEYIDFLKLQKRLAGVRPALPPEEWFEGLEKRKYRKGFRRLGLLAFGGSYILLLGYFLIQFFTNSGEDLIVRILVGGILSGLGILFLVALTDRIKEGRTDKYKGVIK